MLGINPATPEGAAIVDLREQLAAVEESMGDWNGGRVVEVLEDWFGQFSFEVGDISQPSTFAQLGMRWVLTVASTTYPGPGARDRAIRETLGISPTRYFQLLNALLDSPDAAAAHPVTVNRLRRIREEQRVQREESRPA